MTFSAPIVALIFLLGIAPGWFLNRTEDAVARNLDNAVKAAKEIKEKNAAREAAQGVTRR